MTKDTHAETLFARYSVKFELLTAVAIKDIKVSDASKQNIRPTGIDEDRVIQYALAMEQGDEFPPLVLYKRRNNDLHAIGGMHRVEAAKLAKLAALPAYVLQVDESRDERVIEVFQRTLNMYHGSGYSREERIQQGLRFIAMNFSVEDAARMAQLKSKVLRDRQSVLEVRNRAIDMNVHPPDNERGLLALGRIKHPKIFAAVATLAHQARMKAEQLDAFSQEIRGKDTDDGAWEVVNKWKENLADVIKATGGGRYAPPNAPWRSFVSYLDRVESRVPKEDKMTSHERQQIIRVIEGEIRKLARLLALLKSRQQVVHRASGRR